MKVKTFNSIDGWHKPWEIIDQLLKQFIVSECHHLLREPKCSVKLKKATHIGLAGELLKQVNELREEPFSASRRVKIPKAMDSWLSDLIENYPPIGRDRGITVLKSTQKFFRSYSSKSVTRPSVPKTPAREKVLRPSTRPGDNCEPLSSPPLRWVRGFLHSLFVDVELSAMELSAAGIIMAKDTAYFSEFACDFSLHIWDEGRHAEIALYGLRFLGGKLGDYTYTNHTWNKVNQFSELVERIMGENVIEEGNASDRAMGQIKNLRSMGYHQAANLLEHINVDELRHARLGNKWVKRILEQNDRQFIDLFKRVSTKIGRPLKHQISCFENLDARMRAGFDRNFLKQFGLSAAGG
ncbi:MAG: DUF455 family protein [Oligoflexia bacterium]|nr:DUF455 family protein [Oligoflexia bacterium]